MKAIHETFVITIADEDYTVGVDTLIDALKIDPVDAGEDLRTQPGLFAWVATVAAQADYEVGRAKQDLAVVRAALGRELRGTNEGKGRNERITEAGVDDAVTTSEQVMELVDSYNEAVRRAAILGALREAFRQRRDMLNSLAFTLRRDTAAASE
jgi:hypothetical protein